MRFILPVMMVCCSLIAFGQYKNDNVLYKTVYIDELCAQLKSNPNAVLLDVRSKGEYEDTSTFSNLNIGRLKNTVHLDINEMPTRWRELTPHKDKTIYVMCSHSQRSRRVSKMLADSGFANIVNVNGGLSTYNLLGASGSLCKDMLYETHNNYKLLSPLEACNFVSTNKDLFILDVRSDSVYRGISTDYRRNAPGNMNGSVNIPLAQLRTSTSAVPKGKKILVIDDFGNDASLAAQLLSSQGYADVHVLFNGLEMLMNRGKTEIRCMDKLMTRTARYQPISADEFDAMTRKEKDLVIVDVRPAEEFSNQSKTAFRNTGHVRNAVNIPASAIEQRHTELNHAKNKPVVVYNFSNGGPEAYKAATVLANQGFTKVYVLTTGIFNLRWQAANIKGKSHLKDHVTDIPAENQ